MNGRGWHYDQLTDRVRVDMSHAPSYFEHNRRVRQRPLPDVIPADFEPPAFQLREGIVVQEYYECGEGYAHAVGTECRGQCVLRG